MLNLFRLQRSINKSDLEDEWEVVKLHKNILRSEIQRSKVSRSSKKISLSTTNKLTGRPLIICVKWSNKKYQPHRSFAAISKRDAAFLMESNDSIHK